MPATVESVQRSRRTTKLSTTCEEHRVTRTKFTHGYNGYSSCGRPYMSVSGVARVGVTRCCNSRVSPLPKICEIYPSCVYRVLNIRDTPMHDYHVRSPSSYHPTHKCYSPLEGVTTPLKGCHSGRSAPPSDATDVGYLSAVWSLDKLVALVAIWREYAIRSFVLRPA